MILTVFRRSAPYLLAAFALLTVAACSSDPKDTYVERPVEELYNEAMDNLQAKNYKEAIASFDEVDRQHPYSVWAAKAQLMSAYVKYRADLYDEAIIALDRYIDLHPGGRDTAYAYYLRAISYYEQITDIQRDQKITKLALDSLNEVVRRYPQTEYARDAKLKIDLARDHLAGKEMAIGRFYQKRGEYVAAINRFKTVVDEYQTTTHVPEALHRLVECYLALGITDEAQTAAAVLGYNFPGSEWYEDSYALLTGDGMKPDNKVTGWFSKVWNWIF